MEKLTEKDEYFLENAGHILVPLETYINFDGRKNSSTKDDVVEVMVNEPGIVIIEKGNGTKETRINKSIDMDWAVTLCNALSAVYDIPFSENKPLLLARLPGGHRFTCLTGANVHGSGLAISIRASREFKVDLAKFGLDNEEIADLRQMMIDGGNVLISGGTNTGKTTFTNALLLFIPENLRVISAEDVPELNLSHIKDRLPLLVSRLSNSDSINYNDVIDAINRLNPNRIIVGEISVNNSVSSLRLINMGHKGFLSTIHANSPQEACRAWAANYGLALAAKENPEAMVSDLIYRHFDRIIQLGYHYDGKNKVRQVAEQLRKIDLGSGKYRWETKKQGEKSWHIVERISNL